jgi:hypothetical protein
MNSLVLSAVAIAISSVALLPSFCSGARYSQSFNSSAVANGSANGLLSDGGRITGSAIPQDGELLLTPATAWQKGSFIVPALNGSSLGWTASLKVRFRTYTNATPPADGLWLRWGNNTFHSANKSVTMSPVFVWWISTYDRAGFSVATPNVTIAYKAATVIKRIDTSNATVFASWNPENGLTLQTNGFAVDARIADVRVPLPAPTEQLDSLTWSIESWNGYYFEEVAIDDVVISTPCADCKADGKVCKWGYAGLFSCLPVSSTLLCPNASRCHCSSNESCSTASTLSSLGVATCLPTGACDHSGSYQCGSGSFGVGYYGPGGIFQCPDTNNLPCWCNAYGNAPFYPCFANVNNARLRCDDNPRRLTGGECPVHVCLPTPAPTPAPSPQPTPLPTPLPTPQPTPLPTPVPPTPLPTPINCAPNKAGVAATCTSEQQCATLKGEFELAPRCAGEGCCGVSACMWATWSPCVCATGTAMVSNATRLRLRNTITLPFYWPRLPNCDAGNETRACNCTSNNTTIGGAPTAGDNEVVASTLIDIDIPLIAGVAGGAVVLLAVVGVAVAIGMRRRGKSAPSNQLPLSTSVAPSPAKDEPPRRSSEHGSISASAAHGEYGAAPPASSQRQQYDSWTPQVASARASATSSHYENLSHTEAFG